MKPFSIEKLVEKRSLFPINTKSVLTDKYIELKFTSDNCIGYLIVPHGFLSLKRYEDVRKKIMKNWNLFGLFGLAQMWKPYSGVLFDLIVLSRSITKEIIIGKYFSENTFISSGPTINKIDLLPQRYILKEYREYLEQIQLIIDTNTLPKSNNLFDFKRVLSSYFDQKNLDMLNYFEEQSKIYND